MANFYNYPQVVMSLYDVPMEASGALSLGTSAGVGGSFSVTCKLVPPIGGGSYNSVTTFCNGWADENFWYVASAYNGVNSFTVPDGTFCDVLFPYVGGAPWGLVQDVKRSSYVAAFTTECWMFAIFQGDCHRIISFTANDSTGDLTLCSEYRIGTNQSYPMRMWTDEDRSLVYVVGDTGIAVYCYNSTTGALGHVDYNFEDYCYSRGVYSYYRDTCRMVVLHSHYYGWSAFCLNPQTCMLGLAKVANWTADGWFLANTNSSSSGGIWGGKATGSHLTNGGFFIVTNAWCGIGVMCLVSCAGGGMYFCLKSCLDACSGDHFYCQSWGNYDHLSNVWGDDDYIYVTGRCSIVYRLTLNCSTGVATDIDSICTCTSACSAWYPKLFTSQGTCVFLHSTPYTSGGSIIDKPAPHRSISGLYGGADNTNVALSHYYKGGSYVANNSSNTNVPTSGSIDFSDFYGQG